MLSQLDYIAIITYMLLMAAVGVFFGWFIKDIKGYFKGGSTIPWVISAISNFMGLFSTFVFVAYAGVAYADGIVGVTVLWCTVAPCLFAAFVMGKRWVRSGIITPVEYLEARFNVQVRQLFSWAGLGMRFLDNMVRLYAIGIFLVTATGLSFIEAIVYSGLIITLFTIIGGVWAVVVMDTLQFVILVFASVILVPLALDATGGLSTLMAKHPAHFDWFNGPKGQPLWLIVYYFMIVLKYNANWVFIQRFYSVKNEAAARKLGLLTASLFFVFPIVFLFPAIAAVEILPNLADPEQAYVAVAMKLLPAGLVGLMLAAMFSATMSSLNSEFNVMSGVLTNDVYKRMFKPDASDTSLIRVARLNVFLVGIIITIGALFVGQLGGAFEANKLLTGIFAIPLAIPLILGLLTKRTNGKGVILTVVIGVLAGLLLNTMINIPWELATLLEIVLCFLVYGVSDWLFKKSEDYNRRINRFFDRLEKPLENVNTTIDPKFAKALGNLFVIVITLSGVLFIGISIPSANLYGGQLAMTIGIICILLAGTLKWYLNRSSTKPSKTS